MHWIPGISAPLLSILTSTSTTLFSSTIFLSSLSSFTSTFTDNRITACLSLSQSEHQKANSHSHLADSEWRPLREGSNWERREGGSKVFGSLHENNSRRGSPGQNYQNYSCSLSGFTILSAVFSSPLICFRLNFFSFFFSCYCATTVCRTAATTAENWSIDVTSVINKF